LVEALARAVERRPVRLCSVLRERVDEGPHRLLLLAIHLWIGKELILENLAEEERLAEARLRVEWHGGGAYSESSCGRCTCDLGIEARLHPFSPCSSSRPARRRTNGASKRLRATSSSSYGTAC